MEVGKRVRELRRERNMTQEELGEKVGVSYKTISHWENGLREPDFDALQKLAYALGTSMAYLLSETDDPRPPSKASAAAPNREEGIQDGDPIPADLQLYIERAMFKALEKWNQRTEDTPEDEHDK